MTSNDAARPLPPCRKSSRTTSPCPPPPFCPTGSPHRLRTALPPAGAVNEQAPAPDFRNASTDPVPTAPESARIPNVPPDSTASGNEAHYLAVEIFRLRGGQIEVT